ncbi:hypothetical protein [Streptomyces sp. CB01373]|uniref:hypothetical protein n=1 Tax=Streptomyces sp. CB01373 TaxID=2020325 RepID=UPI000C274886|nr:hypothetical protein [Streptomyces sp. CB01373]PJM91670.1 hypothetical protein CG719_32925 [Streptomyces sp. CB01373]
MAALLVLPAIAAQAWGKKVWGGLAPAWPGGGYGFAATVGAMVPFALAALIAPLTRMDWRRSKARTLGWAAAALPGLVWGEAISVVIAGVMRPKHRRDWDSACYAEGDTCWVHVRYPFVWAVGLVTTLVVSALLIVLIVKYVARDDETDGGTADVPSPAAT